MTKQLFIKTFGCQMNVYDSQRIADVMAPFGYTLTDSPEHADMMILNTCHIREKASEKVFSELGRLRRYKLAREQRLGRPVIMGVVGCVASANGENILKRVPYLDLVAGPHAYHRLPEMLAQLQRQGHEKHQGILDIQFTEVEKFDKMPPTSHTGPSAFLAVQEGCDKFCTYCVVPYTRGREYSRPIKGVLEEAQQLVDHGAVELTLVGQNVDAYHGIGPDGKEWSFARLLYALAEMDGLKRLRYTTSHPNDTTDDLIKAHGDIEKLTPFINLPIQSGSNTVLKRMNRRYTTDDYRRIQEKFLKAQPKMQMSSDFIVGFPGETEKDFEETLAFARDVKFIQSYSFKYSPRPGTPAATMDNQVLEAVKEERLARLQDVLQHNQLTFNASCQDQIFDVLFDRMGKKEGQLVGRSPYMQPVLVDLSPSSLNQVLPVRVTKGHALSLHGTLI